MDVDLEPKRESTLKKHALSLIALAVSLAALVSIGVLWVHLPPLGRDIGSSDPGQTVIAYNDLCRIGHWKINARQVYLHAHAREVMKTLEVVETSESGDYGIVFFRYSIGADIFRRTQWVGKVNDKWYITRDLEYADTKPDDTEWLEKMTTKKKKWEADSAKRKFD